MNHIVALSGGKDSTALALRLSEVEPRDYIYFCTPTGDEFPEMIQHWESIEGILGQKIVHVERPGGLKALIEKYNALPNWRQRWCTRQLKIEVAEQFYKENAPITAYVGLRADEDEREGIYGSKFKQRFPLKEWGWGIDDVWDYLESKNIKIPKRTDCARCFFQRISEWWILWKDYPEIYQNAIDQEEMTGYTFRSPGRDTWPASLKGLRVEFKGGRMPRGANLAQMEFDFRANQCRVCSI